MLDQIFAQGVRVPHEVAKCSCSVGSCFLLLILEKVDKKDDARSEMLIQYVVVETGITNSKAGELTGVPVGISAALDSCGNKSILEQLLIEEASVTAQVSNQVAHLRSNTGVIVLNQNL